jgi:gliding motility-associated-like protein
LSYTFQVPTAVDTFTFTYFYAVVFEEPGHSLPEQPRFFVTAYDVETGNLISCASYDYVSSGSIPGFKKSKFGANVLYKEWTPASLQFAGLSGRTVRLEFKTADCTIGGHFGYAYVDVSSACSNILATAPFCIESNSLILNAPYGFQSYTWYNSAYTAVVGTQQSVTITPPPVTSGVFYVDMIPYPGYGCRDTLQAIVTPLPVPDTPTGKSLFVFCQSQAASSLSATPLPGNVLLWYPAATGGIGSTSPPIPSTAIAGETYYYVSQKAIFGCESPRKRVTVKISPTPATSFVVNSQRQCQLGNNFAFSSTSSNKSNPVYYWDFGDGQKQSSAVDSNVTHSYANAASYTVKLKVANDSSCSVEMPVVVTVVPKPVASFSYPSVICEKQTALSFVDNSSVPNGVSYINQWWWNINGIVVQTKSPASATANISGPMPVQLVVATAEGCLSDTNKVSVNVRYRPPAVVQTGTLLCNNEVISFRDNSVMPAGATGESIVKWYWSSDNTPISNQQNTSLNLPAGQHTASLITETNYGCKSLRADSVFIVHEKPQVVLEKNDSCINRVINFTGTDVLNNVDKWYWDFGSGNLQGTSSVSKTFYDEGTYPLTLLTYSVFGCKDTIVKPFVIYENKAFAGRDTLVAKNEPVQLNAHGEANMAYAWTPAIGLNNGSIEAPIATLETDQRYDLLAVTDKGCDSHSSIFIKRYAGPTIYIPSAFTPNADGRNDFLQVMPVGMKQFKYFAVYDRYGEMIYKSTDPAKGWNGSYKGTPLMTGTFVVLAEAVDYRGKAVVQKGTVMLIR